MNYYFDSPAELAAVRAAALVHAAGRPASGDGHDDPEADLRETLRALSRVAPSAGVAGALLGVAGLAPIPLSRDSLEPTAAPLATSAEVVAHYEVRAVDGVGVALGAQRNGSVLVAVRATPAAWRQWLAEVGTEERAEHHDYADPQRVTRVARSYLHPGPYATVAWSPPPGRAHASVAFGSAAIQAVSRAVTAARVRADVCWLVWSVAMLWAAPDGGSRRLAFKDRRLAPGVDLVAAGVMPLHVTDRHGWTLAASNLPIPAGDPLPAWLVAAFGGRYVEAL